MCVSPSRHEGRWKSRVHAVITPIDGAIILFPISKNIPCWKILEPYTLYRNKTQENHIRIVTFCRPTNSCNITVIYKLTLAYGGAYVCIVNKIQSDYKHVHKVVLSPLSLSIPPEHNNIIYFIIDSYVTSHNIKRYGIRTVLSSSLG